MDAVVVAQGWTPKNNDAGVQSVIVVGTRAMSVSWFWRGLQRGGRAPFEDAVCRGAGRRLNLIAWAGK